jgi:aminomethyltransferase
MNIKAYEALRGSAAWIDLSSRGKIKATGEDTARLLHAMSTSNIQNLEENTGVYTFFLSAQGRILSDAHIIRLRDYYLLDTEPETREKLFQHLDKYIIADDVTLEDVTHSIATVSLEGPEAEQVLRRLGAVIPEYAFSVTDWGERHVFRTSSTGAEGFFVFLHSPGQKEIFVQELEAEGIPEADLDTARVVRLENKFARYGEELSDAQIPQETQLMGAISFTKGCYLGQEIVERVRSRGHLNKVLSPIEVATQETLGPGTKISAEGKDVGEIVSSVLSPVLNYLVGFATLRTESLSKPLTAAGALVTPRVPRAESSPH